VVQIGLLSNVGRHYSEVIFTFKKIFIFKIVFIKKSNFRGENKDEPTRSILNVMPTKNDDGASFRCTVWNRALRQEHSLEAGTKVFVNCKFPFTSFFVSFSCFIFYNKQPLLL
jgi:hypothetical protein